MQTTMKMGRDSGKSAHRGETSLAIEPQIIQNIPVPKTTGTGFGDLRRLRRMNRRPLAVFHLLAMSPLGGNGGDTFGYAGTRNRRFANPVICCPPSFGDDAGGSPDYGGHDMAATPFNARSAQTFPRTQKAARRAARLWFTGAPTATLATWRDDAYRQHCGGLPETPARTTAFNTAFAGELARIIAAAPAVPADNRDQYEAEVTDALMEPENVTMNHDHFQWVKEDGSMTEPLAGYAVVLKGVRHE